MTLDLDQGQYQESRPQTLLPPAPLAPTEQITGQDPPSCAPPVFPANSHEDGALPSDHDIPSTPAPTDDTSITVPADTAPKPPQQQPNDIVVTQTTPRRSSRITKRPIWQADYEMDTKY